MKLILCSMGAGIFGWNFIRAIWLHDVELALIFFLIAAILWFVADE